MLKDRLKELSDEFQQALHTWEWCDETSAEETALAFVKVAANVRLLLSQVETPPDAWWQKKIPPALQELERVIAFDRGFTVQAERHQRNFLNKMSAITDEAVQLVQRAKVVSEHPINDPEVRSKVWSMTGGVCAYCEKPVSQNAENRSDSFVVEHVVPASSGGPDNIANYVPACMGCNSAKSDRHVLHFIRNVLPSRRKRQMTLQVVETITTEAAE